MQRRIPRTVSGSPGFDNIFVMVWMSLASIYLFFFLMQITVLTIALGAFLTALMFATLMSLFGSAMFWLMGVFDRLEA